jgi:hypothetical protein
MTGRFREDPEPPRIGPVAYEPEPEQPDWEHEEIGPRWLWRLIRIFVVLLIIGGSAGGWWYLHTHGGTIGGPIPLIRAETGATKIKPTDAGGEAVPYGDQTAYDMKAGAAQVEHLLPPPETPLPKPVADPNAPPPTREIPPSLPAQPPKEVAVASAQAPPVVVKPPVLPEQAPQPTPAAVPLPPPKPTPLAPAPAQAVAPKPTAPPPIGTGEYRVQVAATRDEASGKSEYERMQRAHPELLSGLSAIVVRADLGARGVFWRVQAGPIADKAKAEKLCADLKAVSVGCSVVKS